MMMNHVDSFIHLSSCFSYYLNSHHIDFHCWALEGRAVPYRVMASGSKGVATSEPFNLTEATEVSSRLCCKSCAITRRENNLKNTMTSSLGYHFTPCQLEVDMQSRP